MFQNTKNKKKYNINQLLKTQNVSLFLKKIEIQLLIFSSIKSISG